MTAPTRLTAPRAGRKENRRVSTRYRTTPPSIPAAIQPPDIAVRKFGMQMRLPRRFTSLVDVKKTVKKATNTTSLTSARGRCPAALATSAIQPQCIFSASHSSSPSPSPSSSTISKRCCLNLVDDEEPGLVISRVETTFRRTQVRRNGV